MSTPDSQATKALQELTKLKADVTKFYASLAGKSQLQWLDTFEANLLQQAITATDASERLSCLDQAKGVRTFRTAYLDTLIKRD